jgi:hypothetical protein
MESDCENNFVQPILMRLLSLYLRSALQAITGYTMILLPLLTIFLRGSQI